MQIPLNTSSKSRARLSRLGGCLALLFAALLLAALQPVAWAQAPSPQNLAPDLDPPAQVARLNVAEGQVSFAPAEAVNASGDVSAGGWQAAELNRPLTDGDRLWADQGARAELHLGSTALRMGAKTSLELMALNDSTTQLRVAQGTVQLRVRALYEGQRLEIDTPNLAFLITQPGNYRLDVNPGASSTRVVAQSGAGVLYGDNAAQLNLAGGQQANFTGTALTPAAPGPAYLDGFDTWAADRDRREDQSVSARYVPRETIGYQQLDNYGDWSEDPTYGAVWLPRALPADWAPYRAGRWSWISPWGWTWVDDAPWGFAPFHYGRWAQLGPRWAWVPGRLGPRPAYAPALVGFVGGGHSGGGTHWNISPGPGRPARPGVGWFPLAPGEAYRPDYRASPRYLSRLNPNITINHTPGNRPGEPVYRYQRQPSAVTATTRDDFAHGRPIRGNPQRLDPGELNRAQIMGGVNGMNGRSGMPGRPEGFNGGEQRPGRPGAVAPPLATSGGRPLVGNSGGFGGPGSPNATRQLQIQQAQQTEQAQAQQRRLADEARTQRPPQGLQQAPGRPEGDPQRPEREPQAQQAEALRQQQIQQARPPRQLDQRAQGDESFRQRANEQAQRGQEQQRQAREQQARQAQESQSARQMQQMQQTQQIQVEQQTRQAEQRRQADELSRQHANGQAQRQQEQLARQQQQQLRAQQEHQQRQTREQQQAQRAQQAEQGANAMRQSQRDQVRQNRPPQAAPPPATPADGADAGKPGRPGGPRNRNPER